jgi:hypothetical protein
MSYTVQIGFERTNERLWNSSCLRSSMPRALMCRTTPGAHGVMA